jgi:hypothetical protein
MCVCLLGGPSLALSSQKCFGLSHLFWLYFVPCSPMASLKSAESLPETESLESMLTAEEYKEHKEREAYEKAKAAMLAKARVAIAEGKELELTLVTYSTKWVNYPETNYGEYKPDKAKPERKRWTEMVKLKKINTKKWNKPVLAVRRPGHLDDAYLHDHVEEGYWQSHYQTHGIGWVTHTIQTLRIE